MSCAGTQQEHYTGTGFPRVFYLAYHLYRNYFPLLALTTYRRAMERKQQKQVAQLQRQSCRTVTNSKRTCERN